MFALMRIPSNPGRSRVRLRLQWVPQSQFAGFIVAHEKGFYKDIGLDVQILPAGPDLKPQVTVAAGTDDIGIGVPNQVIAARSHDVPLIAIAQIFQDSANRYILKSKNKISSLKDLRDKPVGLWLGGDEAEFIAMLKKEGMKLSDVKVIPQEFSVIPFLQDKYTLSQVTVYNELPLIRSKGFAGDKLQILSPRDYQSAIPGDVLFTTESYIKDNPKIVESFLTASIRGWKYCLEHPDEALDLILAYNKELVREEQESQLAAVLQLLTAGAVGKEGIGFLSTEDYSIAERVLFESGQISKRVAVNSIIDESAWNRVPTEYKQVKQN